MGNEIRQFSILHISDLHFGPPYLEEVGEAILKRASQWEPSVVVITGDLTQRARSSQFRSAADFLNRLPVSSGKVVVPGNHDIPLYRIWERWITPYRLFSKHISPDRNSHWQTPGLEIVGLDTTEPFQRLKGGKFGSKHFQYCRQAFREPATEAFRVVAFHHPLFGLGGGSPLGPMPGLLSQLRGLGVRMVLCGHVHHGAVIHYPADNHGSSLWVVLCGTSSSSRGRHNEKAGNSINEIHISDSKVTIDRRLYEKGDREFTLFERKEFPLA